MKTNYSIDANVHYCTCSVQVCKTSRFKTNLEEFTNNQIKPDIAISTIYCYILGFFY